MKIGLRQLVMVGGVLLQIGIATDTLWAEEKTAASGEESQPQQVSQAGLLAAMPTTMISPSAHKKQVYVDDLGTVFWPIDLPFWIRLSPSPRDDAPSFLLNSIYESEDNRTTRGKSVRFGTLAPTSSEADNLTQTDRYRASGLSLEIQGQQFVRWVNYLTKEETLFKFVADGAPPVSTLKLREAPVFTKDEHTFFGKGLTATLGAADRSRTGDLQLGKLPLYQLSYNRSARGKFTLASAVRKRNGEVRGASP